MDDKNHAINHTVVPNCCWALSHVYNLVLNIRGFTNVLFWDPQKMPFKSKRRDSWPFHRLLSLRAIFVRRKLATFGDTAKTDQTPWLFCHTNDSPQPRVVPLRWCRLKLDWCGKFGYGRTPHGCGPCSSTGREKFCGQSGLSYRKDGFVDWSIL